MNILGISAYYHDSAAALIVNGELIAAAQEERFTRKKHDSSFPENAIKYCMDEHAIEPDQIDAIVFYDKPLLKFERLLETYYSFAPKGIASFLKAIPQWIREKMFLKRILRQGLKHAGFQDIPKLLFTEHHLSHAASAFYPSNFDEAAILTIDGVGEWATACICKGKGTDIEILKELRFPHSLGLLYSAFTYFLGFKVNSGEYKLMGLAPYGNPGDEQIELYKKAIYEELIDLKEDGSLWLNQDFFSYATGLRMVPDKKWEKLFGFERREPEDEIGQNHCNLALAIQQVTEEVVIRMAKETLRLTGAKNICLAGGVALNCVSNGKLIKSRLFEEVFIQPASGDAGGAIGAALAAYHIYFGKERLKQASMDAMKGSYLGPSFSEKEVMKVLHKYKALGQRLEFDQLYASVAKHLDSGLVVGWMQGRMEFGPRALGNRSILGDPRNADMQRKLNVNIKYRESFRPFAPSVLAEDAKDYFELDGFSPYMLQTQDISRELRKEKPADYHTRDLRGKLYEERSSLPAITHIDYSARIQTVHKVTNPHYWNLLKAFKELTDCSVLVNTSFNVRGEPIVCTPEDAYLCFMRTGMDILVIGNYLFKKEDQPEWQEKEEWEKIFTLD